MMSKWTVEANSDTIATIEFNYPVQFLPERTCRAEQDYDAMEDGVPDCRIWRCSCGEAFPYWRGGRPSFCAECGAKVVE